MNSIIAMNHAMNDELNLPAPKPAVLPAEFSDKLMHIRCVIGSDEYRRFIDMAPDDNTAFVRYAETKYAELTAPAADACPELPDNFETTPPADAEEADRQDMISYMRNGQ